ncbi:hypothetical protein ACFFK0_04420 [Paenibacillus chartarius]|uniref:Uncharacterized protein n=1 Tax=Paenibacillus chartarius TaxID=747481 RepID=A0ABV6DGD9_9BACL
MHLVVSFKYSFNLELAMSELKKYGYGEEKVLAIPMQPFHRSSTLTDMVSEDSASLFDIGLVLGTIGMLLGVIYGNLLTLGPVLWGLFGLLLGGGIGILIQILIYQKKKRTWMLPAHRQVILMIRLDEQDRIYELEEILKPYEPTGMATVEGRRGDNI